MRITITDFERRLVESLTTSVCDFADAVDGLLGCLLSNEDDYCGLPTDGVILEWEETTPRRAWGVGTVVLIDGQLVEPLRVDVALSPSRDVLESGVLCFGDADSPPIEFGSTHHERMVKRLLADPQCQFRWKRRFRRGPEGWQAVGPS